jgi:hypothetical protein
MASDSEAIPSAAPVPQQVSVFATDAPPDTSAWTPDQAVAHIKSWESKIALDPSHPFWDAGNPKHAEVKAFRSALYERAYPSAAPAETSPAAPADVASEVTDTEPVIDQRQAEVIVGNNVSWGNATNEGQPLTNEDRVAASGALVQSAVTLGLSRTETSRLAFTLNTAIRDTVRAAPSYDGGMAELRRQFGDAGAVQAVADANAVLHHLDQGGMPATAALRALGVLNSVHLVRQLAAFAPKLRQQPGRTPATPGAQPGTLLTKP